MQWVGPPNYHETSRINFWSRTHTHNLQLEYFDKEYKIQLLNKFFPFQKQSIFGLNKRKYWFKFLRNKKWIESTDCSEGGNPRPPWASAIQKRTSAMQKRASLPAIQYTSLCHTRASAVQRNFLETLSYVYNKRFKTIFLRSGKIVLLTDYNYLLIVMNSAFDYSLSGLLVLHKLKHFLRVKQDI